MTTGERDAASRTMGARDENDDDDDDDDDDYALMTTDAIAERVLGKGKYADDVGKEKELVDVKVNNHHQRQRDDSKTMSMGLVDALRHGEDVSESVGRLSVEEDADEAVVRKDGGGDSMDAMAFHLSAGANAASSSKDVGEDAAPPRYEETATASVKLRRSRRRRSKNGGALADELGFEVPERLYDAYEERRRARAEQRNRQLECLEVYRTVPEAKQRAGGDACLALAVNGLHPDHRSEVWADKLKANVKQYSSSLSYYQYLELGRTSLSEEEIRLIENDVTAAFKTHPVLSGRADADAATAGDEDGASSVNSVNQSFASRLSFGYVAYPANGDALSVVVQNILVAAALRSPHGYCAGFVVPAAVMLLLTSDEEASFWMLVGFTEDVAPNLVSRSLINLYAEAKFVDVELTMHEPELAAHFAAADTRPSLACAGLFTRFGLGTLPTESALRLWDAMILESGQVLTHFAMVVLKSLKSMLLAVEPAKLHETLDDELSRLFDVSDFIMDAIIAARDMNTRFESLSIHLGERQIASDALSALGAFSASVDELRTDYGPEGIGRIDEFEKEDLEAILEESYRVDEYAGVETAVDKRYQVSEVLMAYDLAVRHKEQVKNKSLRLDEFMRAMRVKSSTSSKLKMLAIQGETVEDRVSNFIAGGNAEPNEKTIKMALLVANGVIPTQRLSSAPVESKILMECAASLNWFSEMRMGARSALIMANFTIPLFRGGTKTDCVDVSIVASRARHADDSPRSFVGLASSSHTEYLCLVQSTDVPAFIVKKRFNDFKELHEELKSSGCYNIMHCPPNVLGTDTAVSVDPHVVAMRTVTLQRYLDQLNACGMPKIHVALRTFLGLEEPKHRASRTRGLCACSPRVSCVPGFFGA